MNKKLLYLNLFLVSALVGFLLVTSCGGEKGDTGKDGVSTVFQILPTSSCANGGKTLLMAFDTNRNFKLDTKDSNIQSAEVCNGSDGVAGSDGKDGANGSDGSNGSDGVAGTDGKDGSNGSDGAAGADGKDGVDGTNGSDGSNGSDGVAGADGKDGTDGKDGLDGDNLDFTPVAILDPCGDTSGLEDEVLLQLGNGTILASLSDKKNGENTRLSILKPGSYQTTDGSNCNFTVHADNSVTPL